MRKGFRSSRGAMRGTMGGAPICLVGAVGFATVAIGVGPFLYSICLRNSVFTWAQVQNSFQRNSVYPFAANFLVLTAYASRQAGQQKWKSWSPSRHGMESVSSTCMPHTGSRTSRRAVVVGCVAGEASAEEADAAAASRSIQPMRRRRSKTLQETKINQSRKRATRVKRFIIKCLLSDPFTQ